MKIRFFTPTLLLLLVLNEFADAQIKCATPIFSRGCLSTSSAISTISIANVSKEIIYSRSSASTPCDNPTTIPANSTVALQPGATYLLTVTTAKQGFVIAGLSLDGNAFFNDLIDNTILFNSVVGSKTMSFTVPAKITATTIQLRILSSTTAIKASDLCVATLAEGELEEYIFNVNPCSAIRNISANDTICSNKIARVSIGFQTRIIGIRGWSPANLLEQPVAAITDTKILTKTTVFKHVIVEASTRCYYSDSTTIFVDPMPTIGTTTILSDGNKCPSPGASLSVNLDTRLVKSALVYQWYGKTQGLIKGAIGKQFSATTSDFYTATIGFKKSCQSVQLAGITQDLYLPEKHTITPTSAILCEGKSVTLKSSITAADYRMFWLQIKKNVTTNKLDTINLRVSTPELTVKDSGRYMLLVQNPLGCASFNQGGAVQVTRANISVSIQVPKDDDGNESFFSYCSGSNVTIASNAVPTAVTYKWVYAQTEQPTRQNLDKSTYSTSESAAIKVIVTDPINGCTAVSNVVNVYENYIDPAKIYLTGDCVGANPKLSSNYQFTQSSLILTWYNGLQEVTSAEKLSLNSYPNSFRPTNTGTYSLIVKDTNTNCTTQDSIKVTAKVKSLSIIKSDTTFCEGYKMEFKTNMDDKLYGPNSAEGTVWTRPDKTSKTVTYPYSDTLAGKYVVSYTYLDSQTDQFCTLKDSIIIIKKTRPIIVDTLVVIGSTKLCLPQTTTLQILLNKNTKSADIARYEWYSSGEGNEIIRGENLSKIVINDGVRIIGAAVGTNGCYSNETESRNIFAFNSPPAALVSFLNNLERNESTLCQGDSVRFNFIQNFNFFGDVSLLFNQKEIYKFGSSSTSANSLYVKKGGSYVVRTKDLENKCTTDTTYFVTEYALPRVFAGNDTTVCNDDSLALKTNYLPIYNYVWSSSNQLVNIKNSVLSTAKLILPITILNNTKYRLYLTQTDNNTRCTAKDSVDITVIKNFDIATTTGYPACSGALAYAKVITRGTVGSINYLWDDPMKQTKDSILIPTNQNFTVKVRDGRGCRKEAIVLIDDQIPSQISIMVLDTLSPSCIGKADGKISIDTSGTSGASTIKWTGITVTDNPTIISNLKSGNYSVTVTDKFGCRTAYYTLDEPVKITAGKLIEPLGIYSIGAILPIIGNEIIPIGNNVIYQWQKNEGNNCNAAWSDIAGATQLAYTPSDLKVNTCFRRNIKDKCDSLFSNSITYFMKLPPADSISGSGSVGAFAKLVISSVGKFPVEVIVRITPFNQQILPFDTTIIADKTPYLFASRRAGTYTILKVANIDVSLKAVGSATFKVINMAVANAILTGQVTLGQPLDIKFSGSKKYPLKLTYRYVNLTTNSITVDSVIFADSLYQFIPTKSGRYELISIFDFNNVIGDAQGFATVVMPTITATADIVGGGYVGSIIKISITPNSDSGPWEVELLLNEVFYKNIIMNKQEFEFPSERPGKYRIRAVNGNTRGNGEAVFIIIEAMPNINAVFVWNAVSPNGDGRNDEFIIQIPSWLDSLGFRFDVDIYDREGTYLKKIREVDAKALATTVSGEMLEYKWNCVNDLGVVMTPGTYFYSFRINEEASITAPSNNQKKLANKSGFIEIRW